MLTFLAAIFFLIITPGPGVLTTAGVGAGFGYTPGLRYVVGLFIGSNLVALAVVSGLAAVLFSVPFIRTVLLAASACYLIYLAAKIAFSGSRIAFIHAERAPGIGGGVLLQVINPKAYTVSTTLFTGFPFMPESLFWETTLKLVIMNAVWIPIHILWLAAGVTLHRLDLSSRTHFIINILMAVSMLAVVGLAALAQL